ncbi:MAG: YlxR family protein [Clostridia bacterium]|nr:YlxR family protein [Clostridia bacterium]
MAATKPKQKGEKIRKIPQRRCVGCGGTFDKKDLLRIVRAPADATAPVDAGAPVDTGTPADAGVPVDAQVSADTAAEPAETVSAAERISIDFSGKKSGRGAYICKKAECLAKARRSGRLKSSLECEITDAVYEQLAKEIEVELRMQN